MLLHIETSEQRVEMGLFLRTDWLSEKSQLGNILFHYSVSSPLTLTFQRTEGPTGGKKRQCIFVQYAVCVLAAQSTIPQTWSVLYHFLCIFAAKPIRCLIRVAKYCFSSTIMIL